ncbi:NAD(+) salvage pathway protein [Suhomyces tanzawaensis NRRL Y-17324]|uniref:nicotinamidase n=1 Tax=Suhomyces tanzawaensis NRRL Y-17324 TaxID=984487 RepID=A0A1E4SFS0_9ASCO|nr:NAD(+) salvage pathway protein [Suhomyces tanzawaensis NRRL Y-17324]ODV78326.1 NAD(+) salvage pathway protein [Suhomyces tanzawaensis NRRL Y-17324]
MPPALIIIDIQEDFLPPDGALAVSDGRSVVSSINELVSNYQWSVVVATQDWHPKDHTSFSSHHNVPPFTEIEFSHPLGELDKTTGNAYIRTQTTWPDHCVQDTHGSDLEALFAGHFNLITDIPKAIIKKGYLTDREYYSCFQDVWGIHHTELGQFLKANDITDVVMVGLAYDFCVLNSAIDSSKLGFNTSVVRDCCRSVYPNNDSDTDALYKEGGVRLITLSELTNHSKHS